MQSGLVEQGRGFLVESSLVPFVATVTCLGVLAACFALGLGCFVQKCAKCLGVSFICSFARRCWKKRISKRHVSPAPVRYQIITTPEGQQLSVFGAVGAPPPLPIV